MPTIERFPRSVASAFGPVEPLTIDLLASNTFTLGASGGGASIAAWKLNPADDQGFSAILDAAIEFSAPAAVLIGNGTTDRVGIYGLSSGLSGGIFLLGVLGVSLGGAAPQIPIVTNGGAFVTTGYSQIICNVGGFTHLAVGAVQAAIGPLAEVITVRARPIIRRVYAG